MKDQHNTKDRTRITPSLVLSIGAMFLALSGVASALPGTDTVNSGDIVNNAVKSVDLKDGKAVTGADIVDGSVESADIGDQIHTHSDTVAVGGGAAENGAYSSESTTATCAAGEELISGSGRWSDNVANEEVFLSEVSLDHTAESVTVTGANDSGNNRTLVAVASCL